MNDTIAQEEYHQETNRLKKALLNLINDLPDDWTLEGSDSLLKSSKISWKKYIAYLTAAVALLAGVAELSGYSIRDIFHQGEPTETPVKVEPPASKVSTTGDNSPAVITDDGDVNIGYGETATKKDSTQNPRNQQ